MDTIMIWIGPIIGGFILYAIISAFVKAPGASLQSKFAKVGNPIAGKTYTEISAIVGPPSSISAMGEGKTLRQWQATGYHVALLFDEQDICLGVSSEISV